jgi:hypothetical protein
VCEKEVWIYNIKNSLKLRIDEDFLLFRLVKMGYVKRDAPSAPRLHAKKKVGIQSFLL